MLDSVRACYERNAAQLERFVAEAVRRGGVYRGGTAAYWSERAAYYRAKADVGRGRTGGGRGAADAGLRDAEHRCRVVCEGCVSGGRGESARECERAYDEANAASRSMGRVV